MKTLKAKKLRKSLDKLIVQGNNQEIENLFVEILDSCEDEFREDNLHSLSYFLLENLLKAIAIKAEKRADIPCLKRGLINTINEQLDNSDESKEESQ